MLGLDAPLRGFFGHVRTGSETPQQLGNLDEFDASPAGLQKLIQAASEYEPVPPTVVDSLAQDLASLDAGADLSYQRLHSTLAGDPTK